MQDGVTMPNGMKKTTSSLALLTFVLIMSGVRPTSILGQQKSSVQKPSFIFRKIEPVLRRESIVPPRLPSFLPYVDEKHPIYPILRSANHSGYDIFLATEKDCLAGACEYGELLGSSTPIKEESDGVRVRVTLPGGIEGYFIDFTCGANCSDSYVGWTEGDYHYSVGMKTGKREQLIKIANSAIAAGSG
jgi:hypothetical protein